MARRTKDHLEFHFEDDDILGRTMRAIIMIADSAINRLTELGWTRKTVNLEINNDDPLPCWVTLKGKRVFEIKPLAEDGTLSIDGVWLEEPKPPGIIDKFWGKV